MSMVVFVLPVQHVPNNFTRIKALVRELQSFCVSDNIKNCIIIADVASLSGSSDSNYLLHLF